MRLRISELLKIRPAVSGGSRPPVVDRTGSQCQAGTVKPTSERPLMRHPQMLALTLLILRKTEPAEAPEDEWWSRGGSNS